MPASSACRPQSSTAARISTAASTLSSDNQHVIAEIRKALSMMRSIAVDLEKQEQYDKLTDFKKLLEDEITKSKAVSPSVPQNNPFYRQFKEAIWVRFLVHGSDFC
ncbi:hypothetical protein BHE74_00058966 [Ensete ventricosum]|nr:hypothetical protein BHE74_00058966 [Ensete ventricosum]RZS02536.1 hypothetical protein BHM03_00032596 [Ensete ventricosum]